jgi:hypothetical protein
MSPLIPLKQSKYAIFTNKTRFFKVETGVAKLKDAARISGPLAERAWLSSRSANRP